MSVILDRKDSLRGDFCMPGDKSVSHRAILLGAIAEGDTVIHHFLRADDCIDTIKCAQRLGISIEDIDDTIIVHGQGLKGLTPPGQALNVGNSGTTIRLLSGILSAQDFATEISGDNSITRRPMDSILEPLRLMGADIVSKFDNNCAPLVIQPSRIRGITYHSAIASAQVKSSILFAGLYADAETVVNEPYQSRNHTELMLQAFGARISHGFHQTILQPVKKLNAIEIDIPGDISSAAYLVTAALITRDSEITIRGIGMNPTRNGFIDVILSMGADIEMINAKSGLEPTCDLIVRSSKLHGITLEGEIIPRTLDEIPILAVLACFAEGTTIIRDAGELKVKESNRIEVMVDNLTKMGAHIIATDDGMIIEGGYPLHGAIIGSRYDHRIAMSIAVAALGAEGKTEIIGSECVNVSYPGFYEDLRSLFPKS